MRMQDYLSQVRHLQSGFESFSQKQIPRSRNTHADSFATFATSSVQGLPRVILVEDLCKPIEMRQERVLIHQIRVGPSLMDPTMLFLKDDILPEEKGKADKVRRKLLDSSYLRIESYTSTLFLGHICYTFILRQWTHS